jgi:hypothetical protein
LQQRLTELLARRRAARGEGVLLLPQEQAEVDALVEAELRAATDYSTVFVRQPLSALCANLS